MADGTKAVVDTSVTDAAALAMALGELPEETPARPADRPTHEPAAPAKPTAGKAGNKAGKKASKTARTTRTSGAAKPAIRAASATAAADDTADATAAAGARGAAREGAAEPGHDTPARPGPGEAVKPSKPSKPSGTPGRTEPAETTAQEPGEPETPAAQTPAAETPAAQTPAAQTPEQEPEEPEQPEETTAPLSAAEIAAELAEGAARLAKAARAAGPAPRRPAPPAISTETLDADTGTLPTTLTAPLLRSGDKIADRYRLEECTTHSEVFSSWRAVDEKLRRAVGVHLLAAGHQRAKAVLTAARSAALLGDPRFVQVLDAVQEGDVVYVIREWLPDASDLARLLAGGPMEPYEAYQMVRQVTDAIAAAHRRGQAHLRLTPTCVLRTETGQYRINGIAVDAAIRGLSTDDAALTDTKAIGALLYAALTHRWPYPEDRYDLQGMPKSLGCVPPDQVKAGVHKGLSELAARALGEHLPHHQEPLTSPEQLAKAIALLPKIRQPEPPAPPAFTPPRYPASRAASGPTAAPRPHHSAGQRPHPGADPARDLGRPAAAPPPRRRGLRAAARWTASLVALAAIGLGSWQLVEHLNRPTTHSSGQPAPADKSPSGTAPAPAGTRLTIAGLSPFNAFGQEKDEHSSQLPNARDDNPSTVWTTQGYNDQFAEDGYRKGTGILVDLGTAQQVSSVDLTFVGDHKVELKAAPAGLAAAPGADEAGYRAFGNAVASGSGSQVKLKPEKPVTTRFLLIWLTGIPNDGDQFRGKVAEIKVNG
ncbi:serine/threonine protein kinase [Kitasatospora sp. NPDC049258]|uniref:protein kinase family protein n=1 Tax=Kitasatospora sp. NPDC049258 TaxID=3155394 RepID=UPI0034340BC4